MLRALSVAVILLVASPALAFDPDPACMSRWEAAEKAEIIYGSGMVSGVPTVMVDETVYRQIDFTTKLGMMDTLNCIVAGPGKVLARAQFVSNRTNNVLAEWNGYKLTVR